MLDVFILLYSFAGVRKEGDRRRKVSLSTGYPLLLVLFCSLLVIALSILLGDEASCRPYRTTASPSIGEQFTPFVSTTPPLPLWYQTSWGKDPEEGVKRSRTERNKSLVDAKAIAVLSGLSHVYNVASCLCSLGRMRA